MSTPPATPPRRRGCLGCLARGCAGCALAALVAVLVLVIAGWALRPGPESRQTVTAAPEARPATLTGPGRVIIELEAGELRIEPGEPGAGPSAEATADTETTELSQDFALQPDGSWTWRVRFAPRNGVVGHLFAGRREAGRVVVRLPPDVPLDLDVTLSKGQSETELGGLDLTALSAHVSMGEHRIRFSKPTARPLPTLLLETSMGQARIDDLGNASPAAATFRSRMGELGIGLGGAWRGPATVGVDFSMGAVRIAAPADVRVVAGDISVSPGDVRLPTLPAAGDPDAAGGAPAVRLDVHGRFGELLVER